MRSYKDFIYLTTTERVESVDITKGIQQILAESGIREGFVLIFPHHTSSAVYISDSDQSLGEDLNKVLSDLIPRLEHYHHDSVDPKKNADAHLKSAIIGHHITIPVSDGKLDLGTYQTIYYAEFDGQREKEVLIKIIGE